MASDDDAETTTYSNSNANVSTAGDNSSISGSVRSTSKSAQPQRRSDNPSEYRNDNQSDMGDNNTISGNAHINHTKIVQPPNRGDDLDDNQYDNRPSAPQQTGQVPSFSKQPRVAENKQKNQQPVANNPRTSAANNQRVPVYNSQNDADRVRAPVQPVANKPPPRAPVNKQQRAPVQPVANNKQQQPRAPANIDEQSDEYVQPTRPANVSPPQPTRRVPKLRAKKRATREPSKIQLEVPDPAEFGKAVVADIKVVSNWWNGFAGLRDNYGQFIILLSAIIVYILLIVFSGYLATQTKTALSQWNIGLIAIFGFIVVMYIALYRLLHIHVSTRIIDEFTVELDAESDDDD